MCTYTSVTTAQTPFPWNNMFLYQCTGDKKREKRSPVGKREGAWWQYHHILNLTLQLSWEWALTVFSYGKLCSLCICIFLLLSPLACSISLFFLCKIRQHCITHISHACPKWLMIIVVFYRVTMDKVFFLNIFPFFQRCPLLFVLTSRISDLLTVTQG